MKKVLAIIGSPRKLGNCEIMVKEISRHIAVPHDLYLLRLSDFNILPCRACYHCLFKAKNCVMEDDFNTILNAMTDADALMVSVPTYFLGLNSSVKRLLDRGLAFYNHFDKLWNTPSLGIVIAGIEGKEGYSLLAMQSFLKLIFSDIKSSKIVYGALPGEIFFNQENKQTAKQLASALFGPALKTNGPGCPQCGGDTFRFLENNAVRCMLCSNDGTISMENNNPIFDIAKSKHEFFLTKEDAINHRDWLLDMKSRFVRQKKELKGITHSYLKRGKWIDPG
ncbi:MAG: flavodoxin family protein [Desulfobacterales bacterium]|nr:MAG: flavodoxin family protein [Desulfobacterales bacterium]